MARVLWVTEHYPPSQGGMAQSCDRIVRGLRAAGVGAGIAAGGDAGIKAGVEADIRVDVAHLTRRNRPWTVSREQGGKLLTAPLGDDPEHALRRLWTTLTAERLDHAYTHVVTFGGTYSMLAAPVLARLLDAPLDRKSVV